MNILNNYVCPIPFNYLEVTDKSVYGCCPALMPISYGYSNNLKDVWNGEIAKKVRESVLDGSYKYCSKINCVHLSKLIGIGDPGSFIKKSEFDINKFKNGPTTINIAFDRSCNLKCPSCRNEIIMANTEELKNIQKIMNDIIDVFGNNIEFFHLCGSAEPFASKTIRNFLLNFDESKFPNLKKLHILTNGLLLNEDMWNNLKHIHKLINSIAISVDAATEETYNKIRVGGDWKILMNNLKFMATLEIPNISLLFVVQDINYFEMVDFYNMAGDIFHNNVDISFTKILNWNTYTDEQYLKKQVWNKLHPEFPLFLEQLNKISGLYRCHHNMYDILNEKNKELL